MSVTTAKKAKIKSIETSFLNDSAKIVDITLSDNVRVTIHVKNESIEGLKPDTEIHYDGLFLYLGEGDDYIRFALVGYFETNK